MDILPLDADNLRDVNDGGLFVFVVVVVGRSSLRLLTVAATSRVALGRTNGNAAFEVDRRCWSLDELNRYME